MNIRRKRIVLNMLHSIFNDLSGKKISHYGSAFKANAGDTRETPAIFVVKRLLEEQAEVVITDPKALKNARADLEVVDAEITYTKDPYEAAQANDPPSGTFYDPENDSMAMGSLGVHEHWNNSEDKQYSRNLGTGAGIELVSSIVPTVIDDGNLDDDRGGSGGGGG